MVVNWTKWIFPILVLCLLSKMPSSAEDTQPASHLDPVVVTATRTQHRLIDTPVITDLITREEIEAIGAENIGEVLENKAGVIIHRDGHGDGVQLQGLDSEYVLILVDGEPQVGRIAGKLDMARMAVENVERIEIVKGATSSLFGNAALAGVINIITRKSATPFSINISQNIEQHNTYDSRGAVGLHSGRLNSLLTLSINRRNPIDLDTSNLTTTIDGYANLTSSARVNYQLSSATNLLFSGQYFTQDQDGISENSGTVYDRLGEIENFSGSLGIEHDFNLDNLRRISPTQLTGKLYITRYDDESTVINRDNQETSSNNLNIQDLLKG